MAIAVAVLLSACPSGSQDELPVPSVLPTGSPMDGPGDGDPLEDLTGLSFADFLDASYEILLRRQPELLTSLGIASEYGLRNDRLDDHSIEFTAETQRLESGILARLRAYERTDLPAAERTSYDVYEWWLSRQVVGHRFTYHDYPVHPLVNSYNNNLILFLTEEHPLETADDATDYLARLDQIDQQVEQLLAGLQRRTELGNVPPDFVISMTINRLRDDLGGTGSGSPPNRLPLYTSFRDRLGGVDGLADDERKAILVEAERLVAASFVPAWTRLIEHLEGIRPLAGAEAGLERLPDGDEYYQHLLAVMTSTDLTAAQIHQIGLDQVERLDRELRSVFDSAGYPGTVSIPDLLARAARDAGFMDGSTPSGRVEVVATWEELIDSMAGRLTPFFTSIPSAELLVVAEEFGAGGYYVPGSVDGSRPGSFHAGVSGSSIPTYIMPTIAYHETFPGHHLQISLAQQLPLPDFRRFNRYNGYTEGWALYAERLAAEMGMYDDDPFGNIGRLELELVRAVRLVTDTGLHARGWTREQAREYMNRVVGWSHEVERYIVMPAQATGYMIGQQEILRLRSTAMERLGDGFDLPAFHEMVLGSGSVPLPVLEQVVESWLRDAAGDPPET